MQVFFDCEVQDVTIPSDHLGLMSQTDVSSYIVSKNGPIKEATFLFRGIANTNDCNIDAMICGGNELQATTSSTTTSSTTTSSTTTSSTTTSSTTTSSTTTSSTKTSLTTTSAKAASPITTESATSTSKFNYQL